MAMFKSKEEAHYWLQTVNLIPKTQLNIEEVKQMDNTQINWLDEELKNATSPTSEYQKLETLKLEDGKIVTFTIDFSIAFNKWTDKSNGTTKAIIPVTHKGVKKNLWLNVKNPLYQELCRAGKSGQTEFKVSTTGTKDDTRYKIVTED